MSIFSPSIPLYSCICIRLFAFQSVFYVCPCLYIFPSYQSAIRLNNFFQLCAYLISTLLQISLSLLYLSISLSAGLCLLSCLDTWYLIRPFRADPSSNTITRILVWFQVFSNLSHSLFPAHHSQSQVILTLPIPRLFTSSSISLFPPTYSPRLSL